MKTCLSPAQVGEHAEVVVVMVATDRQVEEVIAQSGLLDRLNRGSVICIVPSLSWARSAPVNTATTPGARRAAAVSIPRMRACAWGDRTTTIPVCPGSVMSPR